MNPQDPPANTTPANPLPSTGPSPQPNNQSPKSKKSWAAVLMVFIVLIVLAVIAGLTYHSNNKTKTVTTNANSVLVTISKNGFTPSTLKVMPGTDVTWQNNDSNPHEVAANPYPLNNSIPGFVNNDILKKHDSYSYFFTKAGTYTYHDQLNPLSATFRGTVIVK